MSQAMTALENRLLDVLASTTETVRVTDLQIRDAVEACRWSDGFSLSTRLVGLLNDRRTACEIINDQLIDGGWFQPGGANAEHAGQTRRCFDMTTYLLSVIARQLPIYQRITAALIEKAAAEAQSPG